MRTPTSIDVQPGPWFRSRPPLAVGVAIILGAAVFALRLSVHGTNEAITWLFVLPITLVALACGARAGVVAGIVATGLIVAWVAVDDATLTPLGWLTRTVPLVVVGLLVGNASDRLRDAASVEQRLVVAELREREAAEINDAIIQHLAAAKWAIEGGNVDQGLALLHASIVAAEALVAELLTGQDEPTLAAISRSGDGPLTARLTARIPDRGDGTAPSTPAPRQEEHGRP